MVETMVFSYGMLISFVLTGAHRNNSVKRPHSQTLRNAGLVLAGSLATLSALLIASIPLGIDVLPG